MRLSSRGLVSVVLAVTLAAAGGAAGSSRKSSGGCPVEGKISSPCNFTGTASYVAGKGRIIALSLRNASPARSAPVVEVLVRFLWRDAQGQSRVGKATSVVLSGTEGRCSHHAPLAQNGEFTVACDRLQWAPGSRLALRVTIAGAAPPANSASFVITTRSGAAGGPYTVVGPAGAAPGQGGSATTTGATTTSPAATTPDVTTKPASTAATTTGPAPGTPRLRVTPPVVDFGDVDVNHLYGPVGQERETGYSSRRTIEIENIGDAPDTITSIGTTSDEVRVFGPMRYGYSPVRLEPGQRLTVDLGFVPSKRGPLTGVVEIADRAAASPHRVRITGRGVIAQIHVTPEKLDYEQQEPGTLSRFQEVTVENTGDLTLDVEYSVEDPWEHFARFEVSLTTCFTGHHGTQRPIAPGESCVIDVQYRPNRTCESPSLDAKLLVVGVAKGHESARADVRLSAGEPYYSGPCVLRK